MEKSSSERNIRELDCKLIGYMKTSDMGKDALRSEMRSTERKTKHRVPLMVELPY